MTPEELRQAYPHLRDVLGGYLHQDWPLEGDEPLDVLLDGIRRHEADRIPALTEELRGLEATMGHGDEAADARALSDLGAEVAFSNISYSPRSFLVAVLAGLERDAAR